jgi:hypothetical protein
MRQMCSSTKVYTPDTSQQTAEAQRENTLEDQRYQDLLAQQTTMFNQQRADDQARYDSQFSAQQTEAQRQRDLLQAEIDRQNTANATAAAQAEQERQASLAQATAHAQQVRQYVTGRQGLIDSSTQAVNDAYSGFNDQYFNDFAKSFVDYYKPQIEQDYGKQSKDLTYSYANAGNNRSSAAARAFGDLDKARTKEEAGVASSASDAANSLRDSINGQRGDALSLVLNSGAVGAANLPDGMSASDALGGIGSQLGALTQTARNRAQNLNRPSITALPFNLSLAGVGSRPGAAA